MDKTRTIQLYHYNNYKMLAHVEVNASDRPLRSWQLWMGHGVVVSCIPRYYHEVDGGRFSTGLWAMNSSNLAEAGYVRLDSVLALFPDLQPPTPPRGLEYDSTMLVVSDHPVRR